MNKEEQREELLNQIESIVIWDLIENRDEIPSDILYVTARANIFFNEIRSKYKV
jgi:hypothetical protein